MSHYMFAYVITCSSPVSKKDQNYEATRLHFENLVKRYGHPVIILNLIKVVSIFLLFEGNDFIFFPHLSNVSNFLNKQFSCIFANILQKGGDLFVFFFFILVRFLSDWYWFFLTNSHTRGNLESPYFVLSLVRLLISLTKIYHRRTGWGFFIGILNIFRG